MTTTIQNERDVTLQGAGSRDLDPTAGKYLLLTPTTPVFHVSTGGTPSPSSITLTALPVNIGGGTVAFSTTAGTLTGTGNTRVLTFANMPVDFVTITASITDLGQTYTATQAISKVEDGATGPAGDAGTAGSLNGNSILYKWSTVNPGNPAGTATFTWASVANTAYSGGDGWYITVPANPGTAGIQLWTSTKPVTASAGTPTSSVTYSAGATLAAISQNGANGGTGPQGVAGVPGIKNATARAYQWSTGPAPTTTGSATYTWASASYNTPPSGWTTNKTDAPALGYTLYEATVGLVDATGVTTSAIDWTTATRTGIGYMATNGTNGGTGATGTTGNSVAIAYTLVDGNSLAGTPSTIVVTGTGTPALGNWGSTRVWTVTPPVYAAGQSVFQSNGIYNPVANNTTWGLPYLSALRVGSLSAMATDTGTLNVSGTISSANGNFTVDNSGNVNMKSVAIKDASGNVILSSGAALNVAYAAPGTLNSAVTATSIGAVKTDASNAPSSLLNSSLTIGANGVLSGGGGGGVTIGGLGYTGALNANYTTNTNQLTDGANLGGTANWTGVAQRPADDRIFNNKVDLAWWKRDASIPWALNGSEYNRLVMTGTDIAAGGPKGPNDTVWFCQETNGESGAGGGWENVPVLIDPTKTYRFVVPIKRMDGTGNSYWGTENVCTINTTSAQSNPYFATSATLPAGEWFLFIGYIFPASSTGNTHDGAGIYRCNTGLLYAGGANFNHTPGATQVYHRAYQYYASTNAKQIFGRPMINVVDGTEPSLREYFANSAVLNSSLTIGADGVLSGGGGGSVTIGGLGYTGALNANYTTNTNQLADGANLGGTANWSTVANNDGNRPANGATVGATIGVNVSGQIGTANVATFIAAGAIGNTQIGGDLQSTNWNGTTGTTGAGWLMQRSGVLYANSVQLRGAIMGGQYAAYAWPGAGAGGGFYLGSEGLLLGSANDGKYFQVSNVGNVYAPNFSIVNGAATFSGALSGATGSFSGTLSASTITGGTITGSTIKTAASGTRVEMTSSGIQVYGDAGAGQEILATMSGNNFTFGSLSANANTNGIQGHTYNGTAIMGYAVTGIGGQFIGSFIACWGRSGGTGTAVYGQAQGTGKGVVGEGASGSYDFYATGAGINYGPFTGGHDGLAEHGDVFKQGDILVDVKIIHHHNISNTIAHNALSTKPMQKNVIGVFVAEREFDHDHPPAALKEVGTVELEAVYKTVTFNALGEGQINVCGENGDIEAGDYITTSSMAGKGMRQADDILRNYTVAKARESITFSSPTEVKQVACTYHCG